MNVNKESIHVYTYTQVCERVSVPHRSHCSSSLWHLDNVDFCDAEGVDGECGLDSCSVLALLDTDLVAFWVQSTASSDEGEHSLHSDAGGGGRRGRGRGVRIWNELHTLETYRIE